MMKSYIQKKFPSFFKLFFSDSKIMESLIIRFVGVLISYFLLIIINKSLGVEVYGRYSFSISFITIAVVFLSLGIPDVLVKINSDVELNRYKKSKKSFLLLSILSIISSLLIFIGSNELAIYFNDIRLSIYFKIIAIILPFFVWSRYLMEYLRSVGKNNQYTLFNYVFVNACMLIWVIALLIFQLDTDFILFGYFIGVFISILFLYKMMPTHDSKNTAPSIRYSTLLKYAIPLMLVALSLILMVNIDRMMIQYLLNSEMTGYYNTVVNLSSLLSVLTSLIVLLNARNYSKYFSENNMQQLRKSIQDTLQQVNFLVLPFAILNLLVAFFLLQFLGTDYSNYYSTFLILQLSHLLNALSAGVTVLLLMTNSQKEAIIIFIVGVLVNIILNSVFIPLYGLNGAAWATAIASITINVLGVIVAYKKFDILVLFNPFFKSKK